MQTARLAIAAMILISASSVGAEPLTLLHLNDLHARYDGVVKQGQRRGGFVWLSRTIRQIRRGPTPVVFLNAGDTFQGSLYYHQFEGRLGMQLLSLMGLDAMVLGNHEFDRGLATLTRALAHLRAPVLGANLQLSPTSPLRRRVRPWIIVQRGGQRIGIIGLLTPDRAVYRQGLSFRLSDPIAAARDAVRALTAQGVSRIIALTHIGLTSDRQLARRVSGIDVIVGGHSHTRLPNGVWERSPSGEPVLIVQAGQWGRYLGRVDLWFNAAGRLDPRRCRASLIAIETPAVRQPARESRIGRLLAQARRQLGQWTRRVIATSRAALESSWQRETRLGNLVSDAMRWILRAQRVDCAAVNSGAIRGGIPAGPITLGHLLQALPFENRVLVVELTGAQLRRILAHSVAQLTLATGRPSRGQLLQLSGCRLRAQLRRAPGARLLQVRVGRGLLDPRRRYRLAVPDFIYLGGDGFNFKGTSIVFRTKRPLWQLVRDYLSAKRSVNPTIDGRLQLLR